MEFGTWGEWLGAMAGLAAGFIPAILWFFERRDRKVAQDELRDLRAQSESRQPGHLATWIDSNGRIIVYNGADNPAFWVQVHDTKTDTQWMRLRAISAGETISPPEPHHFPPNGIYTLFQMNGQTWRSEWNGKVSRSDVDLEYVDPD